MNKPVKAKDIKFTYEDLNSGVMAKVRKLLELTLQESREMNDIVSNPETTNIIRGRIDEDKRLLKRIAKQPVTERKQ